MPGQKIANFMKSGGARFFPLLEAICVALSLPKKDSHQTMKHYKKDSHQGIKYYEEEWRTKLCIIIEKQGNPRPLVASSQVQVEPE